MDLFILGVPTRTKSAVLLNIVQKVVDPPPFVSNVAEQIFFDGFLKKRVNVCRDKICQKMRKSVETMTNSP